MNWESFCKFFIDLWNSIVSYFSTPDSSGLTVGSRVIMAAILFIVGWFIIKYVMVLIKKTAHIDQVRVKKSKKVFNKKEKKFETKFYYTDNSLRRFLINCLSFALKFLLFIAVVSLLGVNLSGLTTVISSALLAIGLSLQEMVKNFFSGFLLLGNKFLSYGDFIEVPSLSASGTIVEIGMMSTCIDSVNNQRLVIPNSLIVNNPSINYSKNRTRRVVINISVNYNSDVELVKKTMLSILNGDSRVITTIEGKKPSCFLTGFSNSGMDFSLRCHCKNDVYWALLFELNERLIEAFRKNNIKISFTTYNLLTQNVNENPANVNPMTKTIAEKENKADTENTEEK